ncbi:MAG: PKD domain-containing protein, partial [Planctomycetota bacterium]
IYDECKYEGDVPQGWGNISAKEMVRRFWLGTVQGCYVGHGETYLHPKDILWWSKGGVLHGESPERIAFLRDLMEETPFNDMTPSEPAKGIYVLAKPGEHYLVYFDGPGRATLDLPGERPYKVDVIDTWEMTVTPMGAPVAPGERPFSTSRGGGLVRVRSYAPGERMRPHANMHAVPAGGTAPLTVRFTARGELARVWDFGDGTRSTERSPTHTYERPGHYTAKLTVTDEEGVSASAQMRIAVEGKPGDAIVRVGLREGETHPVKLSGKIARGGDGSFDLGDGEPWKWVTVGDGPIETLEGLKSFTILGWARPTDLATGPGGNRIAFSLNYNRSGLDLVHLRDGRLRLSVNEWPDRVRNDSSPGKLRVGEWTFFAVTYDGTRERENVRWYFGGGGAPAEFDRVTSYSRGPTGRDSGELTVGNYNTTLHRHGLDRQFRGSLRAIEVFGSRIGLGGVLGPEAIRRRQRGE